MHVGFIMQRISRRKWHRANCQFTHENVAIEISAILRLYKKKYSGSREITCESFSNLSIKNIFVLFIYPEKIINKLMKIMFGTNKSTQFIASCNNFKRCNIHNKTSTKPEIHQMLFEILIIQVLRISWSFITFTHVQHCQEQQRLYAVDLIGFMTFLWLS